MAADQTPVERLIADAKSGDGHALTRLFDRFRQGLIEQTGNTLNEPPGDRQRSTQLIAETIHQAGAEFETFDGSTEDQFRQWLQKVLQRHLAKNPPPAAAFQNTHDATLHKPTDERTVDLAGSPPTASPAAPATVDYHHAETLAPPPGSTGVHAAETLDPADRAAREYQATVTAKRFGKYELIDVIAKGGMGVVHKARDTKLNRMVALKMILAGEFADQDDVSRFYAEAESAARLRHPNIVGIHEFGESGGQHFFSMDYIEGAGLDALVREHPLPANEAAELVKKVADAMHYAHGEKILHRDLKPSNVLLDASGEPMITDFGLAKHVEGRSQLTVSGTVLGTPSYMPPEQARGELDRVNVVSDVYSIGAILYELLTGRPPFRAANAVETLNQVIKVEPVAPRMLNPDVPVDLETICLKCLQKEPAKRYATAAELSDELSRFLAGKPILARPVGRAERAWRWCRRNPKVAALAAAAILGLLTTFAASTIGYFTASAALARAEQSLNRLRIAIDRLYTLVSETELLNEPGLQPFRKQLLTEARNLYEETLKEQGDQPGIQQELALSYFRLGRIMKDLDQPEEALRPLTKARDIQGQLVEHNRTVQNLSALGDTLNTIGAVYETLNRLDDALAVYDEAIEIRDAVVKHSPGETEFGRKLINVYMNSGLIEKALGDNLKGDDATRRYESALQRLTKAQDTRLALLARAPDDAGLRLDAAKGFYNLGNTAFELQMNDAAQSNLQRAIEQFDVLLNKEPANLENQFRRAVCTRRVGDVKSYSQDPKSAQADYDEALRRLEQLATENPDVHKYQAELASTYINRGELYSMFDNRAKALTAVGRAVEILEPLVAKYPLPDYEYNLQVAHEIAAEIEARSTAGGTP